MISKEEYIKITNLYINDFQGEAILNQMQATNKVTEIQFLLINNKYIQEPAKTLCYRSKDNIVEKFRK